MLARLVGHQDQGCMAIDQQLKRWSKPSHFVDDMRVQIHESMYSSDKPALSTSLRGRRELCWIKDAKCAELYLAHSENIGSIDYKLTATLKQN